MVSKLAEVLRTLPDDGLGALLQLRPDLVVPVPSDISALAARAQTRVSVLRALDGLDQFTLEILDGLRLIRAEDGTASVETLLTLTASAGVEAAETRAAVDRLRTRFILYGPEHALHVVRAVDEICSPYPAGLGRPAADLDPAVAELVADPAGLRRTLLSATPDARTALDRLAAGPPIGVVSAGALRAPAEGAEETPLRWLVRNRLLVAISDDTVELPREIGIMLRREAGPLGTLHPDPPELDGPTKPMASIDSAGAGQALEAIRHLDVLLANLAETPAPVLRSGGLGVRDLRRLAKESGVDDAVVGLLLEVARAAGLLASTESYLSVKQADQAARWLPTGAYDTWLAAPLAVRWALVARAWLTMPALPGLVGQRDDKDRLVSALSPEVVRVHAPAGRRAALRVLADLPDGSGPDATAVLARLAWQSPRRMGRPDAPGGAAFLARAALAEAAALGITGLGALTTYGRVLLTEEPRDPDADPLGLRSVPGEPADPVIAALDPLLPAPVDHVLVQNDLTVVVPGPPEPGLHAELELIAEAESRGGATVFRVTAESIRRALDSGYSAADIHALFKRRSRTGLPQALTYLIDDVSRRHGGLRAGPAGAYLRSDEEAIIAEVAADRRLAGLGFRRLAPTVLVTSASTARLVDALRDAGYAPVPEDASGAAVLTRPKPLRAQATRTLHRAVVDDFDPPRLRGPRLAGVIEQIRLGDRLARAARRSPIDRESINGGTGAVGAQQHTQALAVLQQALRDQSRVWVGYVDAHGSISAKLVRPLSMGAGFLRAEDDRTETQHTFALHRITSAVIED